MYGVSRSRNFGKSVIMYHIKWGELYVHMVSGYVRVDKASLITHDFLEEAQEEASEIARFLGTGLTIYKTEVAYEVEP